MLNKRKILSLIRSFSIVVHVAGAALLIVGAFGGRRVGKADNSWWPSLREVVLLQDEQVLARLNIIETQHFVNLVEMVDKLVELPL